MTDSPEINLPLPTLDELQGPCVVRVSPEQLDQVLAIGSVRRPSVAVYPKGQQPEVW